MINEKRLELEQFIREQTLGPGAMRSRFVDKNDPSTFPIKDRPNYSAELINQAPAAIYSTGILFPEDHSKLDQPEQHYSPDDPYTTSEPSIEGAEVVPDGPTDDSPGEEEEHVNIDSQSLNQMFPNVMGLTVSLNPLVAKDNDLEIIISGRYYRKEQLKAIPCNIGALLEHERGVFQSFLDDLSATDPIKRGVSIAPLDDHYNYIFLHPQEITTKALKNRVYDLKKEKAVQFPYKDGKITSSLDTVKQIFFDQLRREVLPESKEGGEIRKKINEIEVYESILSHILDLISIYDEGSYGLWRCQSFQVRVGQDLEIPYQVKGKKIYSYKKYNSLTDVFRVDYAGTKEAKKASLSVSLQYSKFDHQMHRNGQLFLKVQLKNSSTPFSADDTNNGKNYFSMASEEVNKRCFFGVCIQVKSKHLLPTRSVEFTKKETFTEDEVSRYIYKQYRDLGLGHGCSVKWEERTGLKLVSTEYIPTQDSPDVDVVPRRRSQFSTNTREGYMPSPVFLNDQFLQFKWLSTLTQTNDEELISGLTTFIEAYGNWVQQQQDPKHPEIARQIRNACQEDQERMLKNLDELRSNKEMLFCFRLMNTAMFMQLWHSVKAKGETVGNMMLEKGFMGFTETFYKEKTTDDLFPGVPHASWRPFQLAFIILNLDGIFQRKDDPQWAARNELVDLVWFPTGGGKTEAYLGLIALTIICRRRKYGNAGGGTAVMMRYTLRLLTTQQFQRATLLIMALELIRRWGAADLGAEPIYIGLYVGIGSLPNKLSELFDELKKLNSTQKAGQQGKSRIPIKVCPWCGYPLNPISPREGNAAYYNQRILIECHRPDQLCSFSTHHPLSFLNRTDQGPIPVSLCDEEIYLHPPALLFGTVDKFAQLAHKASKDPAKKARDSRRLFGKGIWETPKPQNGYRHPDLIIQDELHLMMGPLGSAVALFESAIDQLCSQEGTGHRTRPKIISSTATTRNTSLQIMALFDRKVNIFPKSGVDCDDSFFAFYKRAADDEKGNGMCYLSRRKYLGILPTGRTQMWMQLRLAAILFTHRAIFEKKHLSPGDPLSPSAYPAELSGAMNNFHTVLAYFNSLREVGKTQSQVYSYLIKEIRRVFNLVVRPGMAMHCFYTYASCFRDGELTGRLSGEEAVESMTRVGVNWSPINRLAHKVGKENKKGMTPPDFVIATNMISVGLDISRLNTMIVNCMPRNIAEYIQASSRVARDKAGIVITVHHPFRSRDLSHYERFIEFHEKMYSYVEPISITPFTYKALKRYLPLYIATMLRHRDFPDRTSAASPPDQCEAEQLVKQLVGYFQQRMQRLHHMTGIDEAIKKLLEDENIDNITSFVEEALEVWQQQCEKAKEEGQMLVFNNRSDRRPERQLYIDIDEYQDNITSGVWRIPQSLRVVEPEAVIHVKQK